MAGEKAVVHMRHRFGIEIGSGNVEHIIEVVADFEPRHHGFGVLAGAVGHDQLAPGQLFDRRAEHRIWHKRRVVDLMDELEIVVGLQAVLGHQAAHGGAVAAVIILLQAEGFVLRHAKISRDVVANAFVHLLPKIEVMGIERVVEIEHPGFDRGENARCQTVCRSLEPHRRSAAAGGELDGCEAGGA